MPENWRESDEKEFKTFRTVPGNPVFPYVSAHWRGSGIFV